MLTSRPALSNWARWASAWLLAASLPIAARAADGRCPPVTETRHGYRVRPVGAVEAEVCATLAAVLERKAPPRAGEAAVWVARAAHYETDGDGVYERLLADAILASWTSWPRARVVVYDSLVQGGARWTGGDLDVAETAELLAPLAELLDVPPPAAHDLAALERAWIAFIEHLDQALGAGLGPDLPLGASEALDALLRLGTTARLGRAPSLASVLLHELGHRAWRDYPGWAALSGFEEAASPSPEHPQAWGIAIIRLAMGATPGDYAAYTFDPATRFITPYASLTPFEDLAESHAAFYETPERLFALAPEKYLVLNVRRDGRLVRTQDQLDPKLVRIGLERIRARLTPAQARRYLKAYAHPP